MGRPHGSCCPCRCDEMDDIERPNCPDQHESICYRPSDRRLADCVDADEEYHEDYDFNPEMG